MMKRQPALEVTMHIYTAFAKIFSQHITPAQLEKLYWETLNELVKKYTTYLWACDRPDEMRIVKKEFKALKNPEKLGIPEETPLFRQPIGDGSWQTMSAAKLLVNRGITHKRVKTLITKLTSELEKKYSVPQDHISRFEDTAGKLLSAIKDVENKS